MLKERTNAGCLQISGGVMSKQSKICDIKYDSLKNQEYLLHGDRNINVRRFIFKARSKTLDIKTQNKWKYDNLLCSGCHMKEESEDEILACNIFG